MKTLNLAQQFVNMDGSALIDGNGQVFTLKTFLLNVLGSYAAASGEEAVTVFTLAQDIYKNEDETMEIGDALYETVKKAVNGANKAYTVLALGQAIKMLE